MVTVAEEFQCTYCRYIFRSDDRTPECPRCGRDGVVIVADTSDERGHWKEDDDGER